jgi:cytochrome P450
MKRSRPPGPISLSPWGIMSDFPQDPLAFVTKLWRDYGDFVTIPGPLYRTAYLLNDPDLIYQVLVKQADKFQKPPILKKIFSASFGDGLFFSDGDLWRRQRRLAQPAFHHKRIEAYAEAMVRFTQARLSAWQSGQQRYIDEEMQALTLQIITDAIFHTDIKSEAEALAKAMQALAASLIEQASHPLQDTWGDWFPLSYPKQQKIAQLDAIVYRMIQARRQAKVDTGDLISVFLAAVDEKTGEPLSDRQVRDEVVTLFLAGHETTAQTLAWVWVLLAQHAQVEAKLHAELSQALASRPPALADLPQLTYTEAIIKETLRLYPSTWVLYREALVELELGGYLIQKGDILWLTPYLGQRDPRYFEQPNRFWPERFLTEEGELPLEKRVPRFAYYPFGGGPRTCIGNGFSTLQARLVLATIAQRFRLQIPPGGRVELTGMPSLKFKYKVPLQIVARPPVEISQAQNRDG